MLNKIVSSHHLRGLWLRLLPTIALCLFLALNARPVQAGGGVCLWTGATSVNWSDWHNWNCLTPGTTPGPADIVSITGSVPRDPTLNVSSATMVMLTVDSGHTLTLGNTASLNVSILSVKGRINLNGYHLTMSNATTAISLSGSNSLIDGNGLLVFPHAVNLTVGDGQIRSYIEISGGNLTAHSTGAGLISGSITLDDITSYLTVTGLNSLVVTGDINNYGTVWGTGAIFFNGENFINDSGGEVSIASLEFSGVIAQYLQGDGDWNGDDIYIADGASVTVENSMDWHIQSLQIYGGSELYLNDHVELDLDNPVVANGVLVVISDSNTRVNGAGTLGLINNNSNTTLELDGGNIYAPLAIGVDINTPDNATVIAWTSASGGSVKQTSVYGTLEIDSGQRLVVTGALSVAPNGTISGQGTLDDQGTSIDNAGDISVADLKLDNANLSLTGNGSLGWLSPLVEVIANKRATLASQMYWSTPNVTLGDHAVLDLGANPLTINGPSNIVLTLATANSQLIGNGTLTLQGNVTINLGGGLISAPIHLPSGAITLNASSTGSIGQLTVDNATLTLPLNSILHVNGDLSLSDTGKINGVGELLFAGGHFVCLGIVDVSQVTFDGATQILSGGGEFDEPVTVASPAALTVNDDWVIYSLVVNSGGSLNMVSSSFFLFGSGEPLSVKGQFSQDGNSFVTYHGSQPQTLQGIQFTNLFIENSAGVTLNGPVKVSNNLHLTSGMLHNKTYLTCAGCWITRYNGAVEAAPTFSGVVKVSYNGSNAQVTGPELPPAPASLGTLEINDGGGITLSSSVKVSDQLSLNNGILNIGNYTLTLQNGAFKGGGSLQSGSGGTVAYIGKSDGQVLMTVQYARLAVSGGGKLLNSAGATISGLLTLNTNITTIGLTVKLTLTNSATVTGTGDVIGTVERTGPFTLNKVYAFGNPGVALDFTAGTPPSTIDLSLAKSAPAGLKSGLSRTYIIHATGGSGYLANLRLHYLPADLQGISPSNLCLWKYDAGAWARLPVSASDLTQGWIETDGLSSFSTWGLAPIYGYMIDLPFMRH